MGEVKLLSSGSRGPLWAPVVAAAVVSTVVGLAAGFLASQWTVQRAQVTSADPQPSSGSVTGEEAATIQAAGAASRAVVSIVVKKRVAAQTAPLDDFFFGFPYQFQVPPSQPSTDEPRVVGGGSGFIVATDGLIVTNRHVVADPDATYTVRTADGQERAATVLALDPVNDLAVIKVEAQGLPTLPLGDSDTLRVGQTVLAIGFSLGEYPNSVTRGVVSGISRDITASDSSGQAERLDGLLQTDAAINPGNSGGPLINLRGEAVGVNTAVDREGQSVGFAIPINLVRGAVTSVQKSGRIVRPYLGVRYVELSAELAKQRGLPVSVGAYLQPTPGEGPAVVPGSPAAAAGLRDGDVIIELGGQKISGTLSLGQAVGRHAVGDEVSLTVRRGDQTLELKVTLAERPRQ